MRHEAALDTTESGLAARTRPRERLQSQYLLARQIVAYVREHQLGREHHLVETSLAERFGVSRTLIRAALKSLADQRIVEPRRNQGFFLLKGWDKLAGKIIDVRRRSRKTFIGGSCGTGSTEGPESITQVALVERYGGDRSALLRVLARMADEGIVHKNKGRGWTLLPTINTDVSLRSSYDLHRTLEPNGILLECFRIDVAALERTRAAHLVKAERAETVSAQRLFELDTNFHETITSFTRNSFFIQTIQQQNRLRRLMEYHGNSNRSRVRTWLREHLAIIEALQANDLRAATRLMTVHLDEAYCAAAAMRRNSAKAPLTEARSILR